MKKLYFLLLALCCISVQAQQIRGKLLDAQNKPVSFANILLMSSDSAFIAGTVSNDDGTFQVTANKQAALLKISYIGFQEQILSISADKTDLGNILLKEDNLTLNEVVVEANLNKVFGERREFLFSPDDKLKANSGLD